MELLTKIIDAVFKSEKLSTEKIVFALVIAFGGLVYLLGFNVDNMFQTPHALFLLLLLDIMIRLISFLITMSSITKIHSNVEQKGDLFNKLDSIVSDSDKLLKAQNDIAKSILSMDAILSRMYDVVKGKPNRWQLDVFAHLRSKTFEFSILAYCFDMLYTNYDIIKSSQLTIQNISITSKNKPKILNDLKELLYDYIHDVEKFMKINLESNIRNEVVVIIEMYLDDIINILDTTDDFVEKINNIILRNTKLEVQLIEFWKFQIKNSIDYDYETI